jgi:ribosomal protein S18 acetylase RimI-like enzyme
MAGTIDDNLESQLTHNISSVNDTQFTLRLARPEDSLAIYELKKQAFGDSYLLYTIYQAPQSVRYLEKLIAQETPQVAHYFYIVEINDRIVGYYHAVSREDDSFLNYIVVAQSFQHLGLGRVLLNHYEHKSREKGYSLMSLDVFEDNLVARKWYTRQGYRQASFSFHFRVRVSPPVHEGLELQYDDISLQKALEAEQQWGFSKIDCTCGSGQLTLGFIAGTSCKLINYAGISLATAVQSIARHFHSTRKILIISGASEAPDSMNVISAHKSLRLVKPLKTVNS